MFRSPPDHPGETYIVIPEGTERDRLAVFSAAADGFESEASAEFRMRGAAQQALQKPFLLPAGMAADGS